MDVALCTARHINQLLKDDCWKAEFVDSVWMWRYAAALFTALRVTSAYKVDDGDLPISLEGHHAAVLVADALEQIRTALQRLPGAQQSVANSEACVCD